MLDKPKYERMKQYAVYEKVPRHGSEQNGVILGNYNTLEEAEKAKKQYGYDNDNYYVDIIEFKNI